MEYLKFYRQGLCLAALYYYCYRCWKFKCLMANAKTPAKSRVNKMGMKTTTPNMDSSKPKVLRRNSRMGM